jgi:hypothetical protein
MNEDKKSIMNNFCTSIEQSKKLIGLGLNPESADMRHVFCATVMTKDVYQLEIGGEPESDEEYIPAWSLSALLDSLPSDFMVEGKLGISRYEIHIRKYRFDLELETELYQIAYGNYGNSGSWHDMINTPECENLLDAAFEMVCWLKDQEII